MRRALGLAFFALLASGACGQGALPPEGQVVLHVTTDTRLPLGAGQQADRALFDRLSIEVFPSGAGEPCEECTREFALDAELVDKGQASVGIVPPAGVGEVRVRVRMFRAALDALAPRAASTVEQVVRLPAIKADAVQHVTVTLLTEDVGVPRGTLESPEEAVLGVPASGLVGTWAGAAPTTCAGEAGPDEVCIPGGAFWMGDPSLDFTGVADVQGGGERLVVLSPYFLDLTEVTVGAFRASGLAEPPGTLATGNPLPAAPGDWCTYREIAGEYDALPVNCLTWRMARAYCESVGKRLPTEAEFEFAASKLGTSSYVWGEEMPDCEDAIHDRRATGRCGEGGPEFVGSGVRDRLFIDGREVLDLAGNIMEFAQDFWQLDDEPCWGTPGVLWDPSCEEPSALDQIGRSVRGGDFSDPPVFLRAAPRTYIPGESKSAKAMVGFRCARSGAHR